MVISGNMLPNILGGYYLIGLTKHHVPVVTGTEDIPLHWGNQ
jgi:hypothetical protein